MNTPNAVTVLLIEDDRDDQRIFSRYAKSYVRPIAISVREDGDSALSWLTAQQRVLPDIVFVDINLPKLNGRHVLHRMKQDNLWRSIPTVVITGATGFRERYVARIFRADAYIRKPYTLKELHAVFDTLTPRCSTLDLSGVLEV